MPVGVRGMRAIRSLPISLLLIVLVLASLSCAQEVTPTPTANAVPAPPVDGIRGDANGNGVVNMGDTTKVERILLDMDPPTPGADANGDGVITIGDVTVIEMMILGADR